MKFLLPILFLLAQAIIAENFFPWPNGGFEDGFQSWTGSQKFCSVIPQAAHSGRLGLHIHDDSEKSGSGLYSPAFPVTPGVTYALHFWGRSIENGGNIALYHRYYDAKGDYIPIHNEILLFLGGSRDWRPYTLTSRAPQSAATLKIWIHSLDKMTSTADIDDLQVAALAPAEEIIITTTRVSKHCFPVLDFHRIQEIVSMLPETPRGIGVPASNREAWEKFRDTEFSKRIFARAENDLKAPIPDTSDELYLEFSKKGNRSRYESVYFRRRSMLVDLTLAECIDYQGRYLPKIENVLRAILAEKSWVLPAHDSALLNFKDQVCYADLFASETVADLSEMDWLLQDKIPAELRSAIRQMTYHRVFEYHQNVIRNGYIPYGSSWMIQGNNWNAVCTRNIVTAALTFIESPLQRAEILAAAEVSSKFFAAGFTNDGYCSEGVGYWGYGFGFFLEMNEIVLNATGGKVDLLAQNPSMDAVCEYPKNILMEEGLTPYFADCGPGSPSSGALELIQWHRPDKLLKHVGHKLPDDKIVSFSVHAFGEPTADSALAPKNGTLPDRSYFRNAGVLICRRLDDSAGNFTAAIKAGHNAEMHNHNDVGSYVVAVKRIPLALDPAGENYTRRTFSSERYVSNVLNSYGHDVPVVAGKLQATGAEHRGIILTEEFSEEADEILIDMTSAYDCPELVRLTRRFRFDRQNDAVTVTDEVFFSSPQTFQDAIVTNSAYEIASNSSLTLHEKTSALKVTIETEDVNNWTLSPEKIENPARIEPTRIAITPDKPLLHAIISIRYERQ